MRRQTPDRALLKAMKAQCHDPLKSVRFSKSLRDKMPESRIAKMPDILPEPMIIQARSGMKVLIPEILGRATRPRGQQRYSFSKGILSSGRFFVLS